MKELRELTDLQIRILEVLWDRGEATVREVHRRLEPETGLAVKTIGTLLYRLEKQGVLTYSKDGREYRYRARVTRKQVRSAAVSGLVGGLFRGELPAMVSHALEVGDVAPGDVERIREMIARFEERDR